MLPCGCARGHCEAADAADCRRIQASALGFRYSDFAAAAARLIGDEVAGLPPRSRWFNDAVASGREKLTC